MVNSPRWPMLRALPQAFRVFISLRKMSSSPQQPNPTKDSFYLPGEFQLHSRCWMGWPHRLEVWRNNAVPVRKSFVQLVKAISKFEPITLLVGDASKQDVTEKLSGVENLTLFSCETDDAWLRDTGPSFVIKEGREIRGVDWVFNSWGGASGGCFAHWELDDAVAAKILKYIAVPSYRAPFVLEGGSIHVDGEGTLITTEECLLNKNRNPSLDKPEIEELLKNYTGATKVIWLQHGVFGDDDTDGHVDNLCFFVRPGVVALTWTDDQSDPQYSRSVDAYNRLTSSTDAKGRNISVCKIHQPSPIFATEEELNGLMITEAAKRRTEGVRLPASYLNCYLANGAVILPTFDDSIFDPKAIADMQNIFPDRVIVPVPSREFLLGGGNIHCLTQQQPALHAT